MATIPLSATNVRLLSDIRLTQDQLNTRWFSSLSEQTTWFTSKTPYKTYAEMNFIKEIDGSYTVKVEAHVDDLLQASYIMFQNFAYSTKWFYAFISKKTNLNSRSTQLIIKLDVIQTFMFDVQFRPTYVVREHCPLWRSTNLPVINTQDEQLNYGTDYDLIDVQHVRPSNGLKWLVVVSKQAMHIDPDTVEQINQVVPTVIGGSPQPLSFYLMPFIDGDTPVFIGNLGIPITKPSEVLKAMYSQQGAVNNIVSIYITEHCGLSYIYNGSTISLNHTTDELNGVIINDNLDSTHVNCIYIKHIERFFNQGTTLPNIYNSYKTVRESKLLMYPYTKMVIDDMKGNRYELKNEYFTDTTPVLWLKGSLGTSNKTAYTFSDYNNSLSTSNIIDISDQTGIINTDPMDLPVITDMLSAYLQGNRNSIQNAKDQVTFNMTMSSVKAGAGIAGGLISKNPMGAIDSAIDGVQNVGNGIYEIQGMNAKQQDIDNTPPNMATQGNNPYYSYGHKHDGVYVLKYQIKDEYIQTLSDFFNMYGYKVNRVKAPNLRTRQNWNYVQTQNCNANGSIEADNLVEFRSIFDNGITLWHTNDIGNYSLNNGVI